MNILELPWVWVVQDAVVLAATAAMLVLEQRREAFPGQRFLELVAFCFFFAAVFENGAVLGGLYGYGRSLVMVGAVPLSVPALEFLVVLCALRLLERMRLPAWSRPFLVGFLGLLQDFTLDPLAVRQVFPSEGRLIGRWTWFLGAGDANILRVPVYNFPGWVVILGLGSAALLLGRGWYQRSGRRPWVGVVAPFAGVLGALVVLVSPLSQLVLWLGPAFGKGGVTEWVMLGAHFAFPLGVLAVLWRGRMVSALSWREDWPALAFPALFHALDLDRKSVV